MTIVKSTKQARRILAGARDVKVYSLESCFCGKPLAGPLTSWSPSIDGKLRLIAVTLPEYLRTQLITRSSKLLDNGNGHYTIHVHSNLWYTFESECE